MTVDETMNSVVNYLRAETLSELSAMKNAGRPRVPKK
jgi:hypothetical protein